MASYPCTYRVSECVCVCVMSKLSDSDRNNKIMCLNLKPWLSHKAVNFVYPTVHCTKFYHAWSFTYLTLHVQVYGFWYHGISLFIPFLLLILICFLCLLLASFAPEHIPLQWRGLRHPLPTFLSAASSILVVWARPSDRIQNALAQQNTMDLSQPVIHSSYFSGRNSLKILVAICLKTDNTIVTGSVTIGKSICPVMIMWQILMFPRHQRRNMIQKMSTKVMAVSARNSLGTHFSHLGMLQLHSWPLVLFAVGGGGGQLVVSLPHYKNHYDRQIKYEVYR